MAKERTSRRPIAIAAVFALILSYFAFGAIPAQALPVAPTITALSSSGPRYIAVSFTAGANGGTALSTYIYSTDNAATWKVRTDATSGTAAALASPIVITSRSSSNGKAALGNSVAQVLIRSCWALPSNPNTSDFNSNCSTSSNMQSITPGTASAPTITSVTGGNTSLSVAFTAPTSNGGSAITNYEYATYSGGSWSAWTARSPIAATSPLVISGLSNGTTYNVKIRAVNTTGSGAESNSLPGTPAGAPSAPTALAVDPGNGAVTVSWAAPSSNGGSAITGYTVTSSPESKTCTTTGATFCAVSGLTNGTAYTFTVKATNAIGDSAASAASSSVIPGVPDAPLITDVTPGDTQLSIAFSAPNDSGSAITNYSYSTNGGSTWVTLNPASTTSPIVITGLTNSTPYNVAIKAINARGSSASSNIVVTATPDNVVRAPGAPSITSISPANTALQVYFTVGSNGGAAITNYEYTLGTSGTWTALATPSTTSPITIPGLTNGTSYSVKIRAVNSVGSGAESLAATGTPASPPGSPTSVSGTPNGGGVNAGNINLSWTAPASDGGSAITGYKIEISNNGGSSYTNVTSNTGVTSTSYLVGGLTGGTSYVFKVSSINALGTSSPSSASAAIVAQTISVAPTITSIVSGSQQLTINFSLGANGGSSLTAIEYSTDNGSSWYPISGLTSGAIIENPSSFDPSAATPATLTNGTTYPITIRALNGVGYSATSNSISGTPLASASSVKTLTALSLSSGTISPTFAASTFSYTVSVAGSVSSLTVTAAKTEAKEKVEVNGVVISAAGSATLSNTSGSIPISVGSNTITILVTAENGTNNTYTITVNRQDGNANLSALTIGSGSLSPAFSVDTLDYTTTVAYSVTSLTITPTMASANATATVNGSAVTSGSAFTFSSLTVGSNTATIVVTAQDLTTKTYRIVITRVALSTDSSLSALTTSAGTWGTSFVAGTFAYSIDVPNETANLSITATAGYSAATISIGANSLTSGSAYGPIALNTGANTITIRVTAEDTSVTSDYVLTITRAKSVVSTLSTLTTSAGSLSPTFTPTTSTYSITVGYSVSSLTFTPTTTASVATVTVGGVTVTSGQASAAQSLSVGSTTITIVVTAEETSITRTYTITVTRKSNDATLSGLSTSVGTWNTNFTSGTRSYTVSLANTDTGLTFSPTSNHVGSTIRWGSTVLASGSTSTSISLDAGETRTISVDVTAEDGNTLTYGLTVTRANIVPNTPSGLTISASDQALSISWTRSVANTGSAITGYTATATDGTNTFTCSTTVDANCNITGLTNGTSYSVTVVATNAAGNSTATSASSATPYLRPGVPDIAIKRWGNEAITVEWTQPSLGGGTFQNYLVERQVVGQSTWSTIATITSISTLEYQDTNLVRANRYNYRVTVTTSTASSDNTAAAANLGNLAPRTVPGSVSASKSNGKLSVVLSWSAPADDGGSPITGYLIQKSTDGSTWTDVATVADTVLTYTVGSLTKGVSYDFKITAINAIGNSAAPASLSSTAVTVPGALASNGHTPKDLGVELTWTAPTDNGGEAITGYRIESSTDGTTWTTVTTLASTARSYLASTPTKGATYNFRVIALNAIGASDNPAALTSYTAVAKPGNSATPGGTKRDLSFDLTWSAPTDDGGSPITNYVIQKSTDGTNWVDVATVADTVFAYTVTGLTAGVSYQFRVLPKNAVGISASGATFSATAATKPGNPTPGAHTAADQTITVNWSLPTDNGSDALVGFEVEVCDDAANTCAAAVDVSASTTSYQATGLDATKQYTIKVKAKNSLGRSTNAAQFANIRAANAVVPVTPTPTPRPRDPDPTPVTPPTPVEPVKPTPEPKNPKVKIDTKNPAAVIALPENSGLKPGQTKVEQGGQAVSVAVVPNATVTGLNVVANNWSLNFVPKAATGAVVPLESTSSITINRGGQVEVSGTNYLPNSIVKVWIFSEPTLLGEFLTDANGNFEKSVPIPASLALGNHTIQVAGISPTEDLRSMSMPVVAKELVKGSLVTRLLFATGSSKLTADSKAYLVPLTKALLKKSTSFVVSITTLVTKGTSAAAAKKLGADRFAVIVAELKRLGINATFSLGATKVIPKNSVVTSRTDLAINWESFSS